MFSFFKKTKPSPPRASLDDVDLHLADIAGAVESAEGMPRVEWRCVRKAAEAFGTHPAIDQIWTELAAQWLGMLRRRLGPPYEIFESNHLLLLSHQEPGPARRLLEIGDAAYDRLERMLERAPDARGFGKHAVLQFQNSSAYYDYVSYFHSDRDRPYGASAGMHISRGYRHTVLNGSRFDTIRTLVHELAHDMVAGRPLPLWL
ncbi:MAG TPA: hypothetical protein VHY37_02725, partial [Tepidisphaeraceae bacterium]|nr:hypothetical protein [Tepidisphaeraceae bacterium]